jgi:YYY domain-containing protein
MSALSALADILRWWGVLFLLQAAAWPLVHGVFRRSSDRGLAFARPIGLLLVGFVFWLGAVLGLWPNASGSAWLAGTIVLALGLWWARREGRHPWAELRRLRGLLAGQEILFLLAFVLWAVVRMHNPDATGTEKPMELAFINAILKSPHFPPNDPWLSGYAISYYHFGYILVAMLAKLASVSGAIAFNLAIASWFGMAAQSSVGLLRNLLVRGESEANRSSSFLPASLMAPFMLLLVGNLGGLLEALRALRVGWGSGAFWRWLDILELSEAPGGPLSLDPLQFRFWWWWRSSRVINDLDLAGRSIGLQPIDEFPAFSFVLGDLHPHVLALPFGLTVVALAYELMLAMTHARRQGAGEPSVKVFSWPIILTSGVMIGGLAFLNTWDFPIYLAICVGATWLAWRRDPDRKALLSLGLRWAFVVVLAIGLYLPFYVGFASQAGGILPNLIFVTKAQQLIVMFAPLLLPIVCWLVLAAPDDATRPDWRRGLLAGLGVVLGLFILSFFLGGILLTAPGIQVLATEYIEPYSIREAIGLVLRRRLLQPGAAILLGGLIATVVAIGWRRPPPSASPVAQGANEEDDNATLDFVLLLVGAGALLVLIPEFLYLRDQFGVRMNTIFKFYFQSWAFWSIAGSYAALQLWRTRTSATSPSEAAAPPVRQMRDAFRPVAGALVAVVCLAGFLYTPLAVWTKTSGFKPYGGATLDASAHLQLESPEDAAAIAWIAANIQQGPLAEAVGGQYSNYARISTATGIPTVLGWPGHEGQWRGGYEEVGSRESDIEELYRTTIWDTARAILERYGIRYVYFGDLERLSYESAGLAKFQEHLREIYHSENVSLFEVDLQALPSEPAQVLSPPEVSP